MTANTGLSERLRERARKEREAAVDSEVVWQILQSEFASAESKTAFVRDAASIATDHRENAKKNTAFASDLTEAADLIDLYERTLEEIAEGSVFNKLRAGAGSDIDYFLHCFKAIQDCAGNALAKTKL